MKIYRIESGNNYHIYENNGIITISFTINGKEYSQEFKDGNVQDAVKKSLNEESFTLFDGKSISRIRDLIKIE